MARTSLSAKCGNYDEAACLGFRPRRAAGLPGIPPARSSHRSACLPILRASEYVTRMTAPFASSTSLPHLSHTRIVLRAMAEILVKNLRKLCGFACLPNTLRPEQAEQCLLFWIEADFAGADHPQMPRPEIRERSPVEILIDNRGRDV